MTAKYLITLVSILFFRRAQRDSIKKPSKLRLNETLRMKMWPDLYILIIILSDPFLVHGL